MNKRVLIISHSGGMAGAEAVLYEELSMLTQCFTCWLVLPTDSEHFFKRIQRSAYKVKILRWPVWLYGNHVLKVFIKSLLNIPTIIKLCMLVNAKKIDVIYSNSSVNWVGLIVAFFCNKPHVIHFHELPTPEYIYIDKRLDFLFRYLINKTKTKCIYISKAMRAYWSQRLGFSVHDYVIYNPIKKIDVQDSVKGRQEPFAFGFAGTLYPRKNVITLIKAFNEVVRIKPNIKLYLAGEGPQEETIKNLIEKMNLSNNVVLMGQLERIEELFKKIDVFVLPSIAEAMPLVVLEAMSSHKACIVTNECSLHELVHDKEECMYFDPFNKKELIDRMIYMIENANERELMCKKAELAVSRLMNSGDNCEIWARVLG